MQLIIHGRMVAFWASGYSASSK